MSVDEQERREAVLRNRARVLAQIVPAAVLVEREQESATVDLLACIALQLDRIATALEPQVPFGFRRGANGDLEPLR